MLPNGNFCVEAARHVLLETAQISDVVFSDEDNPEVAGRVPRELLIANRAAAGVLGPGTQGAQGHVLGMTFALAMPAAGLLRRRATRLVEERRPVGVGLAEAGPLAADGRRPNPPTDHARLVRTR